METLSFTHKQPIDIPQFNFKNIELGPLASPANPLIEQVNQQRHNKKVNELKSPVVFRKYLATDKGLIFVVFTRIKNIQHDKMLNVVKTTDGIFLKAGDIYMSVTSKIIRHLKRIIQNQKNIIITFAENTPDDDEIKIKFSLSLGRVDCATIISLYQISSSGTKIGN